MVVLEIFLVAALCILLSLALFRAPLSLVFMVLYMYYIFFCLHPSLYLLVSWAWRDWPLTWLTNHHPSVLWHYWLGHVTRKIVSEMTYNVLSGTLNTTVPTIPYHASATRLVNLIFGEWMNRYWCKLAQVVHGIKAWNNQFYESGQGHTRLK